MLRAIASLLLLLAACLAAPAAAKPLQRWDALPAFEPLHLDGAYAGTRVCPMCRHGYDAGIVLFLPHDTEPAAAAALAAALQPSRLGVDDARFRVFVVFTGGLPDAVLRRAVAPSHTRWFVAALEGAELDAARTGFHGLLDEHAGAFVFVQRRLLQHYRAAALARTDLAEDARDAMRLLHELHPHAGDDAGDPDVPQGRLWLAPSRLAASLRDGDAATTRYCALAPEGTALPWALIALTRAGEVRTQWLRSDAHGCIGVSARDTQALRLEVRAPRRTTTQLALAFTLSMDEPEPLVGGPCEGCEAVFDARPALLASHARIAPAGTAGEAMRIDGRVTSADGHAVAGVQVYAYHTDSDGRYPRGAATLGPSAQRHGQLRGWAVTDADGRYRFDTIRPGAYPGRRDPAHVHLHVIEPRRCTYFIDDLIFDDDSRVDAVLARARVDARGGNGVGHPQRDANGAWRVRRDITLGRNVPGYAACGEAAAALTASAPPPG
jgi:protocatechuate 3,4-dioxygenase beta subunit